MRPFLVWPDLEGQLLTWGGQIARRCTRNILNNTVGFVAELYHTHEGNGEEGLQPLMCGAEDGEKACAALDISRIFIVSVTPRLSVLT